MERLNYLVMEDPQHPVLVKVRAAVSGANFLWVYDFCCRRGVVCWRNLVSKFRIKTTSQEYFWREFRYFFDWESNHLEGCEIRFSGIVPLSITRSFGCNCSIHYLLMYCRFWENPTLNQCRFLCFFPKSLRSESVGIRFIGASCWYF